MLPGPPELEIRYRRFFEGRGDAVAPLLRFVRGDGDARAGSGAWAALIVSRIFLLKGNVPLAHSYLRLAAALSGTAGPADSPGEARDATLRLGILVNKALILKAQGKSRQAAALLRAVFDRALRDGEIFVAAKAASNLALCMAREGGWRDGAANDDAGRDNEARDGVTRDAISYLGIAEKYYSAVGCESGLLRTGMTRALLDAKQGRVDEAIDRLCVLTGTCAGERHSRERAVGLLLVAELSLARDDRERAREALDGAAAMRETLERFGPQRLMWLRLESEFNRRSGGAYDALDGDVSGAASVAREAAPCDAAPRAMAMRERGEIPAAPGVVSMRNRAETCKEPIETFITCDPRMAELLREIERAAPLPFPILIEGESGTGKDLVARLVHSWSGRMREPFVPVNAAAIPAELFESIAFGHARGAFTGAVDSRAGFAAAAGRGTLFLDEIGELSPAVQAKLLRLIDRREYIPLGETKPRRFEARIVAATNRDLRADCASGRLRSDLYYRLAPLVFRIPPLRERPGDIAHLALHFADRLRALHGIGPAGLHESALAAFLRHAWPGNARELESEILKGALVAKGGAIRACHLSPAVMMSLIGGASPGKGASAAGCASPAGGDLAAKLNTLEREGILEALRACDGNRTNAARRLGLKRTTLLSAMRRLGIEY